MEMTERSPETKTVLVLGYGGIGRALVAALRATPIVDLVNAADPFAADAFPVDVLAEPNLIRNYDYVINTIPVHDTKCLAPLLISCIRHGVHYLDTNEDREIGKFVALVGAGQSDVLFAPHCGLAPGMINVLGAHLIRKYAPHSVDFRVGALTRFVENEILYTPTWSPAGIVNQYLNEFEVIENRPITYPSVFSRGAFDRPHGHFLQFYKDFYLDGTHYEAFPTSGGLGTMTDMGETHRLKSMVYRSIRLHRHAVAMTSLFNAHGFSRNMIIQDLTRHRVVDAEDFVLVIGKTIGNDTHTVIMRTEASFYMGHQMSAIQKCTVAGVATVLDLHIQQKLPNGFVHQHEIDWHDYSRSRFIQAVNYNGGLHD